MRRILSAVLMLSMALAGCRAKEALDKAKISQDLEKHGTMDLMKDVSKDKYNAPADGKMTDAQMQMYLKVREHEKAIAQVAKKEAQAHADAAKKAGDKSIAGMIEGFKTMGSAADMLTADIRAAKELGYNTQEYLWVKSQVMAASSAAMMSKLSEATSASMDGAYTQMKKSYDEAKDDQTKKVYKDMLDNYDKQRAEMKKDSTANISPAVAYNQQLIAKYDGALNAIATEMAKWEEKPGDAKKSMDEFSKGVDKAVADSKKRQ
ncbi:MAG TPA: hypothetical protein VGQ65_19625 [Thermoanaerobaculia bacterium]|jgi:hypothetical protein|nr:hypothetical protein [Thermoanaerobaculia bacterium]